MQLKRILNEDESKLAFMSVTTIDEFLELWSRFYDNEVFIPTYGDRFINLDGDNPHADKDVSRKV